MKRDNSSELSVISSQFTKEREYWLNRLEGDYPYSGFPRIDCAQTKKTEKLEFSFPADLSSRLVKMSNGSDVRLHMLLMAGFMLLMQKYTGNVRIVLGMPIYREEKNAKFINTVLPILSNLTPEMTFKDLILQIKDNVVEAIENQNYPFEVLLAQLKAVSPENTPALFDVVVLLENIHELGYLADFDFNMIFAFARQGEVVQGVLKYNAGLFSDETVSKIILYLIRMMSEVLKDIDIALEQIELISPDEKVRLCTYQQSSKKYQLDKTLHKIFEEKVLRNPEQIALVYQDKTMTYDELNRCSNQIARVIRRQGVAPDQVVAIRVERSFEMIIGILGILKAGAAYLPLAVDYPQSRIEYILKDSGAVLLLTSSDTLLNGIATVNLKDDYSCEDPKNLEEVCTSANLAYVIYTSGSTGRPKGVMIEHKSAVNLLSSLAEEYPVTFADAYLLKTNYTFDVSVSELFGFFFGEGRLVILEQSMEKEVDQLCQIIAKHQVTHINFTPSMIGAFLNALTDNHIKELKSLRYIFTAGEVLYEEHVDKFATINPAIQLENLYGPTEATVYATRYSVTQKSEQRSIPIGKPLPNVKAYILAPSGEMRPTGVPGELCLGGVGLARGYLHQNELTCERFFKNPYIEGERIYRTGDLARWRSDGNIEFLGRIDEQVKIRGFRIEPAEIEQVLLMHPGINEVIVRSRTDDQGGKYLCAYYTGKQNISTQELREFLEKDCPEYMIPAYFVWLSALPLTASGKVDAKALTAINVKVDGNAQYEEAATDLQAKLIQIYQEVLSLDQIGINDSFIDMGGDSIKAIIISARLQREGLKASVNDLFLYPTIKQLSNNIKTIERNRDQGSIEGEVLLTPIQQWFFTETAVEYHHFNQAVVLRSEKELDTEIICNVFDQLTRHHDALRMKFRKDDKGIYQFNRGPVEKVYSLNCYDLGNTSDYATIIETEVNLLQRSLNLQEKLITLGLFKTIDGDFLVIIIHHLVVDGVSWRILLEDFVTGYELAENGNKILFPNKTDSYLLWSQTLQQYAIRREVVQELSYWQGITESTVNRLPRDYQLTREFMKNKYCSTLSLVLSSEATEKLLRKVNWVYNTEINDILLAALGLAIKEWAQTDRFLIYQEGHGRESILSDIEISRTVGWFTSLFPVLLETKTEDLSYHIRYTKESLRRIPVKGVRYGILKYLTPPELKGGATLICQPEIVFNYLGQFEEVSGNGRFIMSNLNLGDCFSPEQERTHVFDITGMVIGGRLNLSFVYNTHEYRQKTVENLMEIYERQLLKVIEHCISRKEQVLTPTDVGYNKLSLDNLQKISQFVKELEGTR